jgi:hypothetical protein
LLLPFLAALGALSMLSGCATPGKPAHLACGARIDWQVAPEAVITRFECAVGESNGLPAVIFSAQIKNVTDTPRRFRLNVFLLEDNLAGGRNVPENGPQMVAGGDTAVVRVPVYRATGLLQPAVVTLKPLW